MTDPRTPPSPWGEVPTPDEPSRPETEADGGEDDDYEPL